MSEWLTKRGDELVPGDSVGSCGPVESVKPTEDGEVEVTFAPESALGYAARRVGRDGDRVTIIFSSDQPVAVVELEPVLDLLERAWLGNLSGGIGPEIEALLSAHGRLKGASGE